MSDVRGDGIRPAPSRPAALTSAWQAALAAEDQAVFGYDLLGPRLPASRQALARTCQYAHAALRDATAAGLRTARQTPAAASVDYPGLYPVRDATAALRLGVRLEDDCAAAWRYLYLQAATVAPAAQPAGLRVGAQSALTASAVRATRWRIIVDPARAGVPFPGV